MCCRFLKWGVGRVLEKQGVRGGVEVFIQVTGVLRRFLDQSFLGAGD